MTPIPPDNPPIPAEVRTVFAKLRSSIRGYAAVYGAAAFVAVSGAIFWVSLLGDWLFEPSVQSRVFLAGVVLIGLGLFAWRFLVAPLSRPLRDVSLALLLERHVPELNESLLTTVELVGRDPAEGGFDPRLLELTEDRARRMVGESTLDGLFTFAPLVKMLLATAVLVVSVIAFACLAPEGFGIWARRTLALSNELWPRKTRLEIEGFENGRAKVARGGDFEVRVRADTAMPLVPNTVQVRYRNDEGAEGRVTMGREGDALASQEPSQLYTYTFKGVLSPITFEAHGGDDVLRDLRIETVEPPTIVEMGLDCVFPEYTNRSPRRIPVSGLMRISYGTKTVLRGRANKPLGGVDVVRVESQETTTRTPPAAALEGDEHTEFAVDLGVLEADEVLLLRLEDAEGVRAAEPIRVSIAAVPDETPSIAAALAGIGMAITPEAMLPVKGAIRDDYGLAETWFEFAVEGGEPVRVSIAQYTDNPVEVPLETALDLREHGLPVGKKLLVRVSAADRYALAGTPNVGSTERWQLDIVPPEKLLAMLEARELLLRQRFEAIIGEMTENSESLRQQQADYQEKNPESDGDAGKIAELRNLQVQQVLQKVRKNADETLGIALGFDDIAAQLINNRLDTDERRLRLEEGIAGPLHKLAEIQFSALVKDLEALESKLESPDEAPERFDRARRTMQAVMMEMDLILSRMLEMESFNELIEILRKIIDQQKEVEEKARERQKESLRDLL